MKRLALFLAFSLILSALPMNVSAGQVNLRGGPVPTILRIENAEVSQNSNSHHVRFLDFTANQFGIFGMNTTANALLTLSGSDRRWVRHNSVNSILPSSANWDFVQEHMIPANLTGISSNNVLFFGRFGGPAPADTLCVVLIARDGLSNGRSTSNRAILLMYIGSRVNRGNAGVSMPVQFYSGGQGGNVVVQIRGARGFNPSNQDIMVAAVLGGGPAAPGNETTDETAQQNEEAAPDQNGTQAVNGEETGETEENNLGEPVPSLPYPPNLRSRTIRLVVGDINYTIDGIPAVAETAPFIDPVSERTMVPLRMVAESLGVDVGWIEETRTVTLATQDRFLTLQVDTPLPEGMGTPVIVNDRTFIPVRYVGEMLGASIQWNEVSRAVYIRMQYYE